MTSKFFISYRRDDSAPYAGRIHDRLENAFGRDLLFMDVDAIPLGADFTQILESAVSRCDVMLAIIGPRWVEASDQSGNLRLQDPNDFVRIEIASALRRDIPVIPILIDGAVIPPADRLPEAIQALTRRNALSIRHQSFNSDIGKLVHYLKSTITNETARTSSQSIAVRTSPPSPSRLPSSPRPAENTFRRLYNRISKSITKVDTDSQLNSPIDHAGNIQAYSKTIMEDSRNIDAYCNRAHGYADIGSYDLAIDDYRKAIDLSRSNGDTELFELEQMLAEIYLLVGDYRNAARLYDRYIQETPEDSGLYYFRGCANLKGGEYDVAMLDFNKALQLDPADSESYEMRGKIYAAIGNPLRAITDYTMSILLDRSRAESYAYRAQCYWVLGDKELAVADFERALALEPENKIAKLGIQSLS